MAFRCGVALVSILAVLAAGCGREAEPVSSARMAYDHEMITLDPHGHDDGVTSSVLSAVYETLVTLPPGRGVEPCLAERWMTPDDTTWQFRLRQGVVFHDGRPLTVDDVVYSIDRARHGAGSSVATYLEVIEDVVAISEEVVEVRTRTPAPLLLTRVAMLSIVSRGFDGGQPVGTGPMLWVEGSELGPVLLRRWERYWGEPSGLEEVRVRFVNDDALLAEVVDAREVDVVAEVSQGFLDSVSLGDEWRAERVSSLATTILGINVLEWPLSDPRVREAIDLVIDRRELVRATYSQRGAEPAVSLAPPEVFGFSPTMGLVAADAYRARLLLEQAGVGPDTSVRLDHSSVFQPTLDYLVAALGEVGLKVETASLPWESFYRRFQAGESHLFVFGWNFRLADASDVLEAIIHSHDPDRRLGLLNGSGYANVQVDRWIEEASREPRSSRRLELLRKSLARVGQDRPYLALYHRSRSTLLRGGFTIRAQAGALVTPQRVGWAADGVSAEQ